MNVSWGNRSTRRKPATLSTPNPTWPDPSSNQDRRCGKPATNSLSYSEALAKLIHNI
jgi:hypothetical protein